MMPSTKEINNNSNSSVIKLKHLVQADLEEVNQIILNYAKSEVTELIPTITNYITNSGGKRIRPILTLACAHMFDIKTSRHVLLATSVEFIHTATLLHDDVIDESSTRRGVATANQLWGNKASILVGDYLFSQAFRLMVETSSIQALRILSNASAIISEGEVWQLSNISNINITKEDYFKLIHSKTAQLFSAACEVGAVIADGKPEYAEALAQYGMNLGMAFQIVDDVLDYTTNDEQFGKKAGGDFREGKVTLPFIIALSNADERDKKFLETVITSENKDSMFLECVKILKAYDAFDKALNVARQFVEQGLEALEICPDSETKLLFKNLIIELLNRSH
ncbi:Octaprenyl-diphosphate synthase [Candidatus Jidaibacter acanthamoeba]|uniref:Octaprenyl-diphosphate synthase n=2 Tax=Candidatus Jidaibacter acanthamoebae TaxID=86105 RepID=A0A0C1QL15_9RICK|nr:Octaprenyl-diphosphate synthase [Candidatus Jidaibacter acanthamoeba]